MKFFSAFKIQCKNAQFEQKNKNQATIVSKTATENEGNFCKKIEGIITRQFVSILLRVNSTALHAYISPLTTIKTMNVFVFPSDIEESQLRLVLVFLLALDILERFSVQTANENKSSKKKISRNLHKLTKSNKDGASKDDKRFAALKNQLKEKFLALKNEFRRSNFGELVQTKAKMLKGIGFQLVDFRFVTFSDADKGFQNENNLQWVMWNEKHPPANNSVDTPTKSTDDKSFVIVENENNDITDENRQTIFDLNNSKNMAKDPDIDKELMNDELAATKSENENINSQEQKYDEINLSRSLTDNSQKAAENKQQKEGGDEPRELHRSLNKNKTRGARIFSLIEAFIACIMLLILGTQISFYNPSSYPVNSLAFTRTVPQPIVPFYLSPLSTSGNKNGENVQNNAKFPSKMEETIKIKTKNRQKARLRGKCRNPLPFTPSIAAPKSAVGKVVKWKIKVPELSTEQLLQKELISANKGTEIFSARTRPKEKGIDEREKTSVEIDQVKEEKIKQSTAALAKEREELESKWAQRGRQICPIGHSHVMLSMQINNFAVMMDFSLPELLVFRNGPKNERTEPFDFTKSLVCKMS